MHRLLLASAAAAAITGLAACQEREEPAPATPVTEPTTQLGGAPMPTTATEFVQMAAMSNMFEIQSSELVLQQSQEPRIRQFAQTLIADHRQMGDQMQQAAKQAGLAVQTPTALSGEPEEWMQDLRRPVSQAGEVGDDFIDKQITAHERAVAMFETYAASGDVPAIRQVAQEALPILRQHLDTARTLDTADAATTAPGESGMAGTAAPR